MSQKLQNMDTMIDDDLPQNQKKEVENKKNSEPIDKGNVAYFIMLLYGIGSLLPWSAICTALDFFQEKLVGYQPDFVFGMANNGLLTVIQTFILLYGHKFGYILRIGGGFSIIAALMVALPLAANYLNPDAGFAACISLLIIFGAMGGIVQGSIFGLGGILPKQHMGAIMLGNGLSGITLNILRMITLAALPPKEGSDNNFKGSLIYFIIASIMVFVCALSIFVFMRLPYVQYYLKKTSDQKQRTVRRISGMRENDLIDDGDREILQLSSDNLLNSGVINKTNSYQNSELLNSEHQKLGSQTSAITDFQEQKPQNQDLKIAHQSHQHTTFVAFVIMVKHSFNYAWQFLTGIASVFLVTFVVYPGVALRINLKFMDFIENVHLEGAWTRQLFIFIFNIFDTVGRWLADKSFGQSSDRVVLVLTYLRVIFIATFLLIAFDEPPMWLFGSNSDWFKILNMILFAVSNGYCSTQLAIKAPSRAPDSIKEQVGTLIGLFITLGIFLGSLIAIGVGKLFA
eukprot:403348991